MCYEPRLRRIHLAARTPYDHCTLKYLEQAGVRPMFIKLADIGIRGNGHMMMLEKNNMEIAAVISRWLDKALPAANQGR